MRLDNSIPLLAAGYAWFPDRRRAAGKAAFETRLMGRRALALEGPAAIEFFYDERHVQRETAMPEPILGTLFGHDAVHTLDGEAHRVRKALFLALLRRDGVESLVRSVTDAWDDAVVGWAQRPQVVLFDEASRVITRGVTRWAGVPLDDDEVPATARDLTAMVDGFATAGPRHWRARRARGRHQRALGQLVQRVRAGEQAVPEGSAVAVVAAHRDSDGALLEPRVAAVELLNVIRPTVAVSWFLAFSAHALHRWPHLRGPLRSGDPQAGWAFAHEVRRFYPFVPLLAGKAVTDLEWDGERVPAGGLVLIDVWGQDHDPGLWEDPWSFRPERFVGREIGPYELIPQGGGSPVTGHRCPGEDLTIALLQVLVPRLAALDYTVPPQHMDISLRRIPALPRSRVVLADVRVPAAAEPALSAPGN